LKAQLPPGTLLTGVLPLDCTLAAQADAAALDEFAFPNPLGARAGRTTVWTDGACLHPADPLMARAAWGLRADADESYNHGGPVQGCQTAQRGEVAATVAASLLVLGELEVVTDSKYVTRCCARILAGESTVDWSHADLWRQLELPVRSRRMSVRWVKAHLTPQAARDRGVSERDRLGNAAADSNAGSVAACRVPSGDVAASRARTLSALEATQRVLGAVQLKVLQSHSQRDDRQPRQRCWAAVRRAAPCRPASEPPRPAHVGGARRARASRGDTSERSCQGDELGRFFQGRALQPHAAA